MLNGKEHEVLTAVAITATEFQKPSLLVQISRVQFATLYQGQIDAYIASGEPFDKAGAYGI
jgi:septum formation protein